MPHFETDLEFLESLSIAGDPLPDTGPRINYDLLDRVVAKDPTLSKAAISGVFRLIAAYKEWNRAYLDVQLNALKSK